MWVLYHEGALVGTCTTEVQSQRFDEAIRWQSPDARALHPSKLAVAPAMRGQGVVRRCFHWFDEQARQAGCTVIQFMAVTAHTEIVAMYAARFGKKIGTEKCALDGWENPVELTFFERIPGVDYSVREKR